jgi:hypothetical protein
MAAFCGSQRDLSREPHGQDGAAVVRRLGQSRPASQPKLRRSIMYEVDITRTFRISANGQKTTCPHRTRAHIVRLSPDRVIRVAVDGVDGTGKTTFANELRTLCVPCGDQ